MAASRLPQHASLQYNQADLTIDCAHDKTRHKALPDGVGLWQCQRFTIFGLGHLLPVERHHGTDVLERLRAMGSIRPGST